MRVTIEIDEKSGVASANPGAGVGSPGSGNANADASTHTPPVDVLKLAAETGAIDGGPAPNISASIDSPPHPLHAHKVSEAATQASAISAGAAPANK